MRPSPFRSTLPALLFSFLAAACGGGGGGPGSGGTFADIYVADAPAEELLSFQVTIDELRLVRAGAGMPGANLLSSSATVELLGLSGHQKWLVHEDSIPAGLYDSIQLVLKPGSVVARDEQGALVDVDVVTNTFAAPFAKPLALGANAKVQLLVDIQLDDSLSGTTAAPPLVFDPQGKAFSQPLAKQTDIDEIQGIVQSSDAAAGTLVIDAFADCDLELPLGPVTVVVTDTTLLIDEDCSPFDSAEAFFADLVAGSTLLEVHGSVLNQQVVATRIEIEDHFGGHGNELPVSIEGKVEELDPQAHSFELLITEIEDGEELVEPVLDTLGNPVAIPVVWNADTLFFLDGDDDGDDDGDEHEHEDEDGGGDEHEGGLTTSAALFEGAHIEVKFAEFGATPFVATEISIEDEPEVEGIIVDIGGLPDSIVIHVDGDEPCIDSGQVGSSSAPVSVLLGGTNLFLDTQQEPPLTADQLLVGLELELQGVQIAGPPSGPTITPQKVKIRAGRFEGHVSSISPGLSSFNATMTELEDPFGNTVVFGPVTVDLAPGVVISGEADSPASFFALFGSPGSGESLEVEVFGIGTGVAGEIVAHELRAKVD